MADTVPQVGQWYRQENGDLFEVVATDETDRTCEIQYFDGTVEEIEFDAWRDMGIETAEAPEDWSGSVDVDDEDLEDIKDEPSEEFSDPLDYLDRQD